MQTPPMKGQLHTSFSMLTSNLQLQGNPACACHKQHFSFTQASACICLIPPVAGRICMQMPQMRVQLHTSFGMHLSDPSMPDPHKDTLGGLNHAF